MKTSHRTTIAMGVFLAVALFAIGLIGLGNPVTEEVEETFSSSVVTVMEHMPRIGVAAGLEDEIFLPEDPYRLGEFFGWVVR